MSRFQDSPATKLMFVVLAVCSSIGCLLPKYHSAGCKQRGAALAERVEKLKREANATLKIGTPTSVVIRFFETNRIPVSFREEEASGEIHVKGCSPTGCGSDDALVGLRVKVDTAGTVTAVPEVVALYTDCM